MSITRREFGATLAAAAPGRMHVPCVTSLHRVPRSSCKYGTAFPADHPGAVRIKEAAEAIRKDTGGRVDLQVLSSEPARQRARHDLANPLQARSTSCPPQARTCRRSYRPQASTASPSLSRTIDNRVGGDGRRPWRSRPARDRKGQPARVRQGARTTAIATSRPRPSRSTRPTT